MKSKTLVTIAVASTFGWSAATFAGSGHEVITPLSVNETGEVVVSNDKGFSSRDRISAIGVSSQESGSGALSGSYSDSSGFSGNSESASLAFEDSVALADEGIYSDFYVVSWTPLTIESWDYYVIDTSDMGELALSEEPAFLMPTHELALIPSESDEMIYELALVPLTFDGSSDGATGE